MGEKKTQNNGSRYAYVLGEKVEPSKHLHGSCSLCGGEVFAKCGPVRIAHWAHKSKVECETYSRDMSVWHSGWQDKFPEDWREEPIIDLKISKRHRADILTADNLVIEFQHSPIDEEEQLDRETFYPAHSNGMVWVVDATCHIKEMKRFDEEKQYFRHVTINIPRDDALLKNYYVVNNADIIFPHQWSNRKVFVFFDYFDADNNVGDNNLYCLFPEVVNGERLVWECPLDSFVSIASNISKIGTYLTGIIQLYINEIQRRNNILQSRENIISSVVPLNRGHYTGNNQLREREYREGIRKANARNNAYSKGKRNGKSGYKGSYKPRKGR